MAGSSVEASRKEDVRSMYEGFAATYADMMDVEIGLPMYTDCLGRLRDRIAAAGLPANYPVLDTACGPGHMLAMYREQFDEERALVGLDLAPAMVKLAREKIKGEARVEVGDMCELKEEPSGFCSAVVNFYALQHVSHQGAQEAFVQWFRVLVPGGQLVVHLWEGSGAIDYGGQADIVALRYTSEQLQQWAKQAGFTVAACAVVPGTVEEFAMDAVSLEAFKPVV